MPHTSADLVFKALVILGKAETGQPPEAEDAELLRDDIGDMRDELAREQALYIQDVEAIDGEYFLPLATILASRNAEAFGKDRTYPVEEFQKAQLRSLQRLPRPSRPLRACYF